MVYVLKGVLETKQRNSAVYDILPQQIMGEKKKIKNFIWLTLAQFALIIYRKLGQICMS